MNQNKLFKRFIGTWDFQRTIRSQRKNTVSGVVIGVASITEMDQTTLYYQEKGVFTTNLGDKTNIHREYIYKYCPREKKIEKFFSINGSLDRLFYLLLFKLNTNQQDIKAEAFHLCNQDRYEAEYTFFDGELFENFSLMYRVAGPKKAYTSETMFKKF